MLTGGCSSSVAHPSYTIGSALFEATTFREVQHHVAARLRAAGLDEAQMPGRYVGVRGQIELARCYGSS
jgi:hypothetical protein